MTNATPSPKSEVNVLFPMLTIEFISKAQSARILKPTTTP